MPADLVHSTQNGHRANMLGQGVYGHGQKLRTWPESPRTRPSGLRTQPKVHVRDPMPTGSTNTRTDSTKRSRNDVFSSWDPRIVYRATESGYGPQTRPDCTNYSYSSVIYFSN